MNETEIPEQIDPCLTLYAQVIKQAVDDFTAGVHRMYTDKKLKVQEERLENYLSAKWFLFDPQGLELELEQLKLDTLIDIDHIRTLALKATKSTYRCKKVRNII